MRKHIGLLGRGIKYSLSPRLQGAALTAAGLDWDYSLLDTEPEELEATLDKLRHKVWAGANVTVPYKQLVMPLLDELDKTAAEIGAVNTIVNRSGSLVGYNTDAWGLARDLHRLGLDPSGKDIVLVGAGGAAAAVLTLTGNSRVSIICRRREQGEMLAKGKSIHILPLGAAPTCDILFNCTPPASGWQDLCQGAKSIYDLNYHETCPPQGVYYNGLGMLVYQGAEAFRLWTGQQANLPAMAAAAGLEL